MASINNNKSVEKATGEKNGTTSARKEAKQTSVKIGTKNDTGKKPAASTRKNADDRKRSADESSGEAKRARGEKAVTTPEEASKEDEEFVDKAAELGFKAGDRLEVEWAVGDSETKHHWGATLLEHDGRTKEGFALRTLDYDPYPEGGFLERSKEDVVFITQYLLISPETGHQLNFKREGEDEMVDFNEDVLNEMLANSLQKNKAAWSKLDAAQQAQMGEMIRNGKERLLNAITRRWEEKPGAAITTEEVPGILEQAFEGM